MAPTALDASISAIDALIEKLQSGALLGAAAPPPAAEPAPPAAAKKAAKKEKPVKPAKSGGGGGGGGAALEGAELFGRAHFAVARVASVVPHPASDKLYITQLDVGGGATRQVVAGLRKHVAQGALEGSTVAVMLNLKPARLAGEASDGMILAASVPQGDDGSELVQVLVLPEGAQPGDPLFLEEAGPPPTDGSAYAKQLKSEQWRKIAAGLAAGGGEARFEGKRVVTRAGAVGVPGMPDGAEIH